MLSNHTRSRRSMDSTVPMLDMAFQILIFFLLAGSIAAPLASDLKLVRAEALQQQAPPNAIVLHPDGQLTWNGQPADLAAFMAAQEAGAKVQIVPDRDASAQDLVALGRDLRALGAEKVVIVTEKGLPE